LDRHHLDYAPDATAEAKQVYWTGLAERLFRRLNVRAPARAAADHAHALWQLLGPASFYVYPDVPDTLRELKAAGYPLAVVSNWQCGLSHYCAELGIRDAFDHVVVSAEFGCEKPDARIFREACSLLGKPPDRVLHIGDTFTDDVEGARAAGLHAVLLCRQDQPDDVDVACISSLNDIADVLGLRDLNA
jgi:HAD superfamily hydrolase (TIGR01549 family)